MINLVVAAGRQGAVQLWLDALNSLYAVSFSDNIAHILSDNKHTKEKVVLVLDAQLLTDKYHLALICQHFYKVIVLAKGYTSDQKIECIYKGAWGYSDYSVTAPLIARAIEVVLNDEVWLERHLIPQLLKGAVIRSQSQADNSESVQAPISSSLDVLSILTKRELEVIKLVYNGEYITSISETLCISVRTVKAHLSAVYRKLNVADRFQLIVFLKNLHLENSANITDLFDI